jgi:metallo-beta-lactamase family protein
MKISFHGAARNVTGSKHLIRLDKGFTILLDCGLFQGMGHDTDKLNRHFGFDPKQVDVLVLSHAHIDHSGLIPRLVALGFKGKIYATPATIDLAKILLADSAKIQSADLKYTNRKLAKRRMPPEEVLYTDDDVKRAFSFFVPVKYNHDFNIDRDVVLRFTDAGHIIGSAVVNLQITEQSQVTRLAFSGDVGRFGDMILRSPQVFPQADIILLESTYGDKLHDATTTGEEIIERVIQHTCVEKKGKLIIPAFSVGRTQEILYLLNKLDLAKKLPRVNVYVDSPLSAKATQIIENHAEGYNSDVLDLMKVDEEPFNFDQLIFIDSAEESRALNDYQEPCIIISASGMAEAGRVKHHLWNGIEHEKNSVLFVGYCESRSLGGKLIAGAEMVSIFGERLLVKAEIFSIRSMSAHGDQSDLLRFLQCQRAAEVKKLFLVHGEYDVQLVFKEKLIEAGFRSVEIPSLHQEFEV